MSSNFSRILFPTDFSEAANQHLPYVTYLLGHIKPKELCVLHVSKQSPSTTPVEKKSESQENDGSSSDDESGKDEYLAKLIKSSDESNVIFKPKAGKFIDVLKTEANQYQLLIMGTHGRHYVQGKLLGSNCSKVVSSSSIRCPILVIPTHKITNLHIHKMIYATSFRNDKVDTQSLKRFIDFSSYFNAKIIFLHVDKFFAIHANENERTGYLLKQRQQSMIEKLEEEIDKHCPEKMNRKYHVIIDKSITKALVDYSRDKQVDLLALTKMKRGFISNLFHSSVTKNMSLFTDIPLMIFNQGQI